MIKLVVIAALAAGAGAAGGAAGTWAAPAKTVECVVRVEPPKDISREEISKLLRPN